MKKINKEIIFGSSFCYLNRTDSLLQLTRNISRIEYGDTVDESQGIRLIKEVVNVKRGSNNIDQ